MLETYDARLRPITVSFSGVISQSKEKKKNKYTLFTFTFGEGCTQNFSFEMFDHVKVVFQMHYGFIYTLGFSQSASLQ